jgi:hypothetical protein
VLLFLAAVIFLILLFVAPIKLYGIHRDIRRTNDLLQQQTDLIASIEYRNRVQVGLLTTLANMIVKEQQGMPLVALSARESTGELDCASEEPIEEDSAPEEIDHIAIDRARKTERRITVIGACVVVIMLVMMVWSEHC